MKLTQTFAFEKLTVTTGSAVSFTSSVYDPSPITGKQAWTAYVSVETDSIRYRTDGTAPNASTGHQVAAGDSFEITGEADIRNFRAIGSGSTASAIIQVSFGR